MNETRPSRFFRRLLFLTAGLCFAALATVSLAADSDSASEPIPESEVTARPVALDTPRPHYTESARRARIEGKVILEAVIDEKGRVTRTRVLKGLPMGLDQKAVEAARTWRFKPATLKAKPVKTFHVLIVDFNLKP